MQRRAGSALSPRVVRVDSQSRPCDVLNEIGRTRATHAVVFQGAKCAGIVSAAEAVKYAPQRPFGALLPPGPPAKISCDLPLDVAVRVLADWDVDAALVVDEGGDCAGVATRESLLAALLAQNEELARHSPTVGADGSITGVTGVAADVTESRQAERQSRRLLDELAQAGRISTMGEMASGLAHELNQPLAAIVAYVDACQELVEAGKMDIQQLSAVLRSVSSQADRAGQIIHRLRKMIKRGQPVRADISVNDAVREVTELLDAEARQSGVTIHLELPDGLPEISANILQIQHVVLNLVRNGLEAMTDAPADQRRLTIATRQTPAGEVEIAVRDLGHGLNGLAPDQLFEPFFTTKPGGMGLGLSISRTIVDAHGGRISLSPNTPRGATAGFTLPHGGGKAAHDAKADRIHR